MASPSGHGPLSWAQHKHATHRYVSHLLLRVAHNLCKLHFSSMTLTQGFLGGSSGSDSQATVDDKAEQHIFFNQQPYASWLAAFDKAKQLHEKNQDKPKRCTWNRVDIVVMDAETHKFRLRCSSCHSNVQLTNPASFFSKHGPPKCADNVAGSIVYEGAVFYD